MFDVASPVRQRARGTARVAFAAGPAGARLADLHQSGSARVLLPRIHSGLREAVFLNSAGGLTGGDRLSYRIEIGAGARAVGTTPAAERGYRSVEGAARLTVSAAVGRGGHLAWLPQETILYEDSDLERRTDVELAADATLALGELVIFGRRAMGEVPRRFRLHERRRVTRDGRPLLTDPLILDCAEPPGAAGRGGAPAYATLISVAPAAAEMAERVRMAAGADCAVSGWDGRLVLRGLGAAEPLRRALLRALGALGVAQPAVWPR